MQESQRSKWYSVERKKDWHGGNTETVRNPTPKTGTNQILETIGKIISGRGECEDSKLKLKTKLRVSKQNQIHGIRTVSQQRINRKQSAQRKKKAFAKKHHLEAFHRKPKKQRMAIH